MIQAAHFDIKTVTGLRQALVLSAEYENEPFPLEGYTLHGSIGTYPRMDLKCSVDENGRARIEWDSVPPGNWKYDVFLISASNDETPLMEGTFTALPRITPVLDDESVNDEVGGVLHLPSGNEGTITLEVDGGFVSKEYAAIAKDAADKAQQALEDIKQALQGVVTSIGGASGDILLDSGLKITGDREKGNVSLSLDDKTVVLTAGDQTIDGVKTFSSPPVIASAPASNNEAANKKYVDDMASKATGTTINGVSGNITLNLPMELDPDTKSMSVDLSGYASLQTDNVFEGGNTFMAGIKGHVDSVTGTDILYATNVPGDSSSGHPVLTIEHIGSSNVRISSGTHLMLKARGGNIYAESSFTANGGVNVYGSALFNSGVTASQSLTVGGHAQFNDTVRVETGKIDPGNFGHTWIFGSLIDSPTTADNNNHRLCCKSTSDNTAYILYHERVVNGAWMKDKIIPACQFDFSWHNDASLVVKDPTKAEQAANKNYVDSQFNCLSLSYMTLDTPQTVKAEKTFTGNVNINTNGNNGTLTLKTSGGVGYLVMDTGEFSISVDYLTLGGHAQFNDTVRVETGKIDPGNFGHTWIFGSLIDSPTTADNNNHRLCCKSTSDNTAYILYHERVVNGAWMKDKIIPACQFDFSWHNDASLVVKDPTKAEQAANKNYVDSQFNCLSLSYMTLDTPQTVKAEKTFTGNVNINTNGNNGTLTLKTSGGVGYLVMDTGEFSISVDYLTLGGQTFVQTLNVAESSLFTGSVTVSQYLKTSSLDAENVEASTINLVDSYDLSCIDLMPFYGSPDEASLIFHPAQTGPGTTDYDIQLYFTYGSSGGFADWLAGPSIQMMRFHPAIGFYNAVSYSNPVIFLGSATFSALLKAQQAEIDQLKINSPLYEEGFLAWQDAGGLSMTRPSITESLYDADNPKAMLNREDNDQRYLQVKSLTAAEYAALGSYSPTTLYRITDADPAAVYLGDLKLSVAAD